MATYNYSTGDFEKAKAIAEHYENGDIIKVTNSRTNQVTIYEVKTIKSFIKQPNWDDKNNKYEIQKNTSRD